MVKFIRVFFIILFVFFVCIFVIEKIFKNHINYIEDRFEQYYKQIDSVDILLIGNSHIQALGAPIINNHRSFNFSFGGQDIFHAYAIINSILKRENKVRTIILGIDYDLLGYDYVVANTMWLDRLYYKNTKMLYDSSWVNQIIANSNFFKANRKFSNIKSKSSSKKSDPFSNFAVKIDCKKRATEHSVKKYDKTLINNNTKYFLKIIALCKQNDVRLIILNSPKTSCYCNFYNEEVVKRSQDILNKISNKYDLTFIDYWKDLTFADSMFVDNDHLNPKGVNYLLESLSTKIKSTKEE